MPDRSRASRQVRRGFTFVELVVVITLGLFLIALFLRAADNASESDNRVKCAANLRMIGQAMILYSNENNGAYPRGKYDPEHADKPNCYTASSVADPFSKEGPINDVTAALFLLVRQEDLGSEAFVCITSGKRIFKYGEGKTAQNFSNFPNRDSLSYSMHNPFLGKEGVEAGGRWNITLPLDFVLAGDMNPGGDALTNLKAGSSDDEMRKGNSLNHAQEGQNLLFADGRVLFVRTPFRGPKYDNVFTYGASGKEGGGAGVNGPSRGPGDCVLLPAADDGSPPKK